MNNVIDLRRIKRFGYALGLLGAMFAGSSNASAQEEAMCVAPPQFTWCDTFHESTLEYCCGDWKACDDQAYENNGGSDDGPWHCAVGQAVSCGRGEFALCYTL